MRKNVTNKITSNELERYKCLLEQVRYEGNLLWTVYNAYLILHGLILIYLITNSFILQKEDKLFLYYRPEIFIPSLLALILCIPWFFAFKMTTDTYSFRMAQARQAEPKGWDIVDGIARKFSQGELVQLGEKEKYRLSYSSFLIRVKKIGLRRVSMFFLFVCFSCLYFLLIINSGFWWK